MEPEQKHKIVQCAELAQFSYPNFKDWAFTYYRTISQLLPFSTLQVKLVPWHSSTLQVKLLFLVYLCMTLIQKTALVAKTFDMYQDFKWFDFQISSLQPNLQRNILDDIHRHYGYSDPKYQWKDKNWFMLIWLGSDSRSV